jgi:hypothetical protein
MRQHHGDSGYAPCPHTVFGHYIMDYVKTLLILDLLSPLACGVLYSELT